MGKKSKHKKIRKIAANLPTIHRRAVIGSQVPGYEITEAEAQGMEVDPKSIYRRKQEVAVPLNHERKMKQLYQKHGPKGVEMYVRAVVDYETQRQVREQAQSQNNEG
jgi:hypothetical protein